MGRLSDKRRRHKGGSLPFMSEISPTVQHVLHRTADRQGKYREHTRQHPIIEDTPVYELKARKDLGPDFLSSVQDGDKYMDNVQKLDKSLDEAERAGIRLNSMLNSMRIVNASRKAAQKRPGRVRRIIQSLKGSLRKFKKSLSRHMSRRRTKQQRKNEEENEHKMFLQKAFTERTPQADIDAYFADRSRPGRVQTDAEHAAMVARKKGMIEKGDRIASRVPY